MKGLSRSLTAIGGILAGCLALACFASLAYAQEKAPRPGIEHEYRLIDPPQPVETGDKIEVLDFFWYGCPYCNALQPALAAWSKRKPADVVFRHVPALKEAWVAYTRIFYTLEALSAIERLHPEVYRAYHVDKLRIDDPAVIADWAVHHGIDRKQWVTTYSSADVDKKVQLAKELTRTHNVRGTPSLVVDGRYITSSLMVRNIDDMVPVLDELIRLARLERAKN